MSNKIAVGRVVTTKTMGSFIGGRCEKCGVHLWVPWGKNEPAPNRCNSCAAGES